MTQDARIILAGRTPDVANALMGGASAANTINTVRRGNALADLYRTQGAGILAGDPNALNALAGMDPAAALGARQTQQAMEISRGQYELARQQAARAAAAQARQLSAEQAAAEAAALQRGLMGAAAYYQAGDEAGYNAFLQQNGMDPAQYPFAGFLSHAAQFEGVMDALNAVAGYRAGPEPDYVTINDQLIDRNADGGPAVVPVEGLQVGGTFRAATPEEAARYGAEAGQIDTKTGRFYPIDKASGMVIESDGQGGFRMVQGAGVTGDRAESYTDAQSKNIIYYTRATGALEDFEPVANAMAGLRDTVSGSVPVIGNYLVSDEYQVAETAGKEFLAAILRKDTGAAITAQEMVEYGAVYFPRPGDSPERLEQKRRARQRAIQALQNGMGAKEILALETTGPGDAAPAGQQVPQIGDVVEGYRYTGGDPASASSWRKVGQ